MTVRAGAAAWTSCSDFTLITRACRSCSLHDFSGERNLSPFLRWRIYSTCTEAQTINKHWQNQVFNSLKQYENLKNLKSFFSNSPCSKAYDEPPPTTMDLSQNWKQDF